MRGAFGDWENLRLRTAKVWRRGERRPLWHRPDSLARTTTRTVYAVDTGKQARRQGDCGSRYRPD
jgi:hypothetical protein